MRKHRGHIHLYVIDGGSYHKYATIRSTGSKKCVRTFRLGEEYSKENIGDRLISNQRDYRVTQRYYDFLKPYIARLNAELDEVTAVRSKVRNKQRNCTDPVQMEELKKRCAACTTVLADLRKKKKTACNILEDNPKLRALLECELATRLENDPYLSEQEKRAIRQETSPQRKENSYER